MRTGDVNVYHPSALRTAERAVQSAPSGRLDNTLDYEMRSLAGVDLLVLDNFALQALDTTETGGFYQLGR